MGLEPDQARGQKREILRITGLHCWANSHEILTGIDFISHPGEMLNLVGPNGAGKTTLLLHLSGYLSPHSGTVLFQGQSVHDLPPQQRAKSIALVRQEMDLLYDFSVEDLVKMGRTPYLGRLRNLHTDDLQAVHLALKRTEMVDFSHRSVRSLSSGERQRVLIARALAQEPEVLLLDEPTANLDLKAQHQVMTLIRSLAEGGMTVIMAIHDLNLAARYSHRVLLISEGQIVADGPPERVITVERIREVYGVNAVVEVHPITGSIQVVPLS